MIIWNYFHLKLNKMLNLFEWSCNEIDLCVRSPLVISTISNANIKNKRKQIKEYIMEYATNVITYFPPL